MNPKCYIEKRKMQNKWYLISHYSLTTAFFYTFSNITCIYGILSLCDNFYKFLIQFYFQYNLSGDANKPCSVIAFNKCTLMLDCALDLSTASNFLPLPLVPSLKLNNLNVFNTRDADPQLEGVCLLDYVLQLSYW